MPILVQLILVLLLIVAVASVVLSALLRRAQDAHFDAFNERVEAAKRRRRDAPERGEE